MAAPTVRSPDAGGLILYLYPALIALSLGLNHAQEITDVPRPRSGCGCGSGSTSRPEAAGSLPEAASDSISLAKQAAVKYSREANVEAQKIAQDHRSHSKPRTNQVEQRTTFAAQ